MKILLILSVLFLIGCGAPPSGTDSTPIPDTSSQPDAQSPTSVASNDPSANPTSAPTVAPPPSVSIAYYSLTQTRSVNNGGSPKNFTSTAHCTIYQGGTYCWDDGLHAVTWPVNFTVNFSYWEVFTAGCNVVGNGTVAGQDCMTAPIAIGNGSGLYNSMLTAINAVLNTGIQTQVSCTESAGVIDCGSFVIDTNLAPLL